MTALKFLLGDKNVEVVISGMRSVSEVAENIAVASCTYYLNNPPYTMIKLCAFSQISQYSYVNIECGALKSS